ncbi:MAG TPA: hypothetical protein IGS53_13450 [Leptolyngbyaceae cyanobacterium M33_DOE_097]|nr:hypothetical protein [Leptolyngbyaceae cyanobacterium M33_DOE_097]
MLNLHAPAMVPQPISDSDRLLFLSTHQRFQQLDSVLKYINGVALFQR